MDSPVWDVMRISEFIAVFQNDFVIIDITL